MERCTERNFLFGLKILLTPQAWNLHIFLGAATKDQPYYADTLRFVQELQRLHIPYHLDIESGYHSWRVWQVQFYHALLWLHWG
jgi:S-formylglutathione hydrolase FrmB